MSERDYSFLMLLSDRKTEDGVDVNYVVRNGRKNENFAPDEKMFV